MKLHNQLVFRPILPHTPLHNEVDRVVFLKGVGAVVVGVAFDGLEGEGFRV